MQLYVLPLKDIHYQNVVEGFSGMLVSENSSMTLTISELTKVCEMGKVNLVASKSSACESL